MNLELARPAWLLLLGLLPLWWWWTRPRANRGLLVAEGAAAGRLALRRPLGAAVEAAPKLLRAAALACLVLGLSQPRLAHTHRERVNDGLGVVIAVDLSTSMLAEDMAQGVNRLQAAKAAILRFLGKRTDDIGLVVFAGETLTRLPLTHDRSVVESAVSALEIGLLRDGTDIAGATAAAGGLFRDEPHRSKLLILVTDGAHNKPGLEPAEAARAAAAYGVKVYAIAIGSGEADAARNQAMETVLSQTARITGGRYFRAADVAALDRAYSEIDALAAAPSPRLVDRTSFTSIAPWFLAAALVLLLAGLGLRASRWGVAP